MHVIIHGDYVIWYCKFLWTFLVSSLFLNLSSFLFNFLNFYHSSSFYLLYFCRTSSSYLFNFWILSMWERALSCRLRGMAQYRERGRGKLQFLQLLFLVKQQFLFHPSLTWNSLLLLISWLLCYLVIPFLAGLAS